MISSIEIYKAIRERLTSSFCNVVVQQKDDKNVVFPSFYIQYVGKSTNKQAWQYFQDNISFNITYFAKENKLLELLEVEEALTKAFKPCLNIPDGANIVQVEINAINTNINENDYFLSAVLDFSLMQLETEKDLTSETIENMDLTIKENENLYMEDIDENLIKGV